MLPYLRIAHDLREEVGSTSLRRLAKGCERGPEGCLRTNSEQKHAYLICRINVLPRS